MKLDMQAQALLKQVQRQVGVISKDVEQAISQQSDAPGATALTAAQLEQVLIQAMPDRKDLIKQAGQEAQHYKISGPNPQFLTQLLDIRVEKENNQIDPNWSHSPSYQPVRRDPYYTKLQMDPEAEIVLLFNARDVDRNGQPLLMKIIAREDADLSKIDLSRYRTRDGQTDVSKFDVMKVRPGADYVSVVDATEPEFTFGDPLKQISLDKGAKEISTSVAVRPKNVNKTNFWMGRVDGGGGTFKPDMRPGAVSMRTTVNEGEQLDTQRVATFDDRVYLKLKAGDAFPESAWLDQNVTLGQEIKVELGVERGLMFEPGSKATINFAGNIITTEVPDDDAQLLGAPAASMEAKSGNAASLRQWLESNIQRTVETDQYDRQGQNFRAVDLIFAHANDVSIGGAGLNPLADTRLTNDKFEAKQIKVSKRPYPGDGGSNDQKVSLTLGEGFLGAKNDASIKNWKIAVGFTDAEGKWQQKTAVVGGKDSSKEFAFEFDLNNGQKLHLDNKNIEIRVYNENGVPAQRLLVPLQEIDWDHRPHNDQGGQS